MNLIERKQTPKTAFSNINQPSLIENDHIIDIKLNTFHPQLDMILDKNNDFQQNFINGKQLESEPSNVSIRNSSLKIDYKNIDNKIEANKTISNSKTSNITKPSKKINKTRKKKTQKITFIKHISGTTDLNKQINSGTDSFNRIAKNLFFRLNITSFLRKTNDMKLQAYYLLEQFIPKKSILKKMNNIVEKTNNENNLLKIHIFKIFYNIMKFAYKKIRFDKLLIIHPYQDIKIIWDIFHLLIMIFMFFYIPLDLCFNFKLKSLLIIITVYLFIDNLLGFNTAFFQNGKLITDRKKIIQNYMLNFFCDLFTQTSIMYDLMSDSDNLNIKFMKLIFFIQYRNYNYIYQRLIDRFKIDMKLGSLLDFITLICTSICVLHWIACGWYSVADYNAHAYRTWLHAYNLIDSEWYIKYLYSFYWSAVSVMTVGYGDIIPQNKHEILFSTIITIFGCGLFAYYISYIGILLSEINKNSMGYKYSLKIMSNLMEKYNINMELRLRIKEYLRFIWKEEKTQLNEEESKILNYLSRPLKKEFLLSSLGKILLENPLFFTNFSKKSLQAVIMSEKLTQIQYTPGDIIFKQGENTDEQSIYFITKGEVEIFNQNEDILPQQKIIKIATLEKGNYFGEVSFFSGKERSVSARSTSFSTIFMLKRIDFINIISNFSDDWEKFHMMKDQLNINLDYSCLRSKCLYCNIIGHQIDQCPHLHYIPNKEKVIKIHEFSISQERFLFNRSKKKKNIKLIKANQFEMNRKFRINLQSIESENEKSSSDDEYDESPSQFHEETDFKSELSKQFPSIRDSTRKISKKLTIERNSIEKEKNIINADLTHLDFIKKTSPKAGNNNNLANMDNITQNPKELDQHTRPSFMSVSKRNDTDKSLGRNFTGITSTLNLIPEWYLSDLRFDKITYLKNYFPENNLKFIINKKYAKKYRKKEVMEIRRISQYTFKSEQIYEHFFKKFKSKTSRIETLTEPIQGKIIGKKKLKVSLLELINLVMMSPKLKQRIKKVKYSINNEDD